MLGENRSKAAFSAGSKECVREEKPLFESGKSFSEARKKSEHLQIGPDDPAGENTWPVAQEEEVPVPGLRHSVAEPKPSASKLPERDTPAPRLAAPEKARTLQIGRASCRERV